MKMSCANSPTRVVFSFFKRIRRVREQISSDNYSKPGFFDIIIRLKAKMILLNNSTAGLVYLIRPEVGCLYDRKPVL